MAMKKLTKISPFALLVFPMFAFAALDSTEGLIFDAKSIVKNLLTLVAAIALLVFFWGIAKFIYAQGNEAAKTEAKKIIVWGLIALFVMVSVWGIIGYFQDELLPGENFQTITLPGI